MKDQFRWYPWGVPRLRDSSGLDQLFVIDFASFWRKFTKSCLAIASRVQGNIKSANERIHTLVFLPLIESAVFRKSQRTVRLSRRFVSLSCSVLGNHSALKFFRLKMDAILESGPLSVSNLGPCLGEKPDLQCWLYMQQKNIPVYLNSCLFTA